MAEKSSARETSSHNMKMMSVISKFLFTMASFVVISIAFGNSINWHFQRFWGASGSFWQDMWNRLLVLFNYDTTLMSIVLPFIVPFIAYWTLGLMFAMIDLTGRPKWLLKYKIQDTTEYPIPRDRFLSVIRQVLINQCLVSIPIIIIVTKIRSLVGYDDSLLLPTFHRMIFEFVIFILIEEVLFYYGHRGLHHPFIYKYFHKKHHEWQSPIAITAIYCHPIEHVVSNIFPAVMGPILVGSHLSTSVMWFTLAISNAVITHSGYHLPLLPSPESHDYHHLKFNQNYGVLGILDRLHGTDAMFRKTKSYNRHILLLSLVPIKKLIPDDHDDYDDAKPR